jgi:hypothetical protein
LQLAVVGIFAKQELDVASVALLFFDDDVPTDEFVWIVGAEESGDIGTDEAEPASIG